MTETAEPSAPAEKKKRKIGLKHKMALLQIIERKQISDKVDYEPLAIRTGISNDSLRQLYSQWKKGLIDMGEPISPEEKRIDQKVQHETILGLVRRHEALIMNGYQAVLFDAEDAASKGTVLAHRELGLSTIGKELKEVRMLREVYEKGYTSILDEERERREREQKRILGAQGSTLDAQVSIARLSDEERARKALEEHVS